MGSGTTLVAARDLGPVSYTHLDVYKRQAYICAQGGYATLMIDADLRRSKLHRYYCLLYTSRCV